MNRKQTKLVKRVERAGVRNAKKTGHAPTPEELKQLKVQILPDWSRILLILTGISSATFGFLATQGITAVVLVLGGLLVIAFGIFGVRRTLDQILEAVTEQVATEILEAAFSAIVDTAGSFLDVS